jgi:hypothetical protein
MPGHQRRAIRDADNASVRDCRAGKDGKTRTDDPANHTGHYRLARAPLTSRIGPMNGHLLTRHAALDVLGKLGPTGAAPCSAQISVAFGVRATHHERDQNPEDSKSVHGAGGTEDTHGNRQNGRLGDAVGGTGRDVRGTAAGRRIPGGRGHEHVVAEDDKGQGLGLAIRKRFQYDRWWLTPTATSLSMANSRRSGGGLCWRAPRRGIVRSVR